MIQTQCPNCQTIFRVTSAHLNIAQGYVRCSHCQHIFNATHHLLQSSESNEPESFQFANEHAIDLKDIDIPELQNELEESSMHRRSWGFFLRWTIIMLLFAALLAAQGLWFFQRDIVLQHPQIRPWLDRFCHTFLCVLPPTRNLHSFQIQEHVAQVHPDIENAIQFDATFINNAAFSQPYPDLQLTFEDFNGNSLAQRRFKPEEYLQRPVQKNELMSSKGTVHLKLILIEMNQVIEGDKIAEGYRFNFF
jgi:predicted Zn finger-like uncharacterized protein